MFIRQTDNGGANRQRIERLFLFIRQVHRCRNRLDIGAQLLAQSESGVRIREGHFAQQRRRLVYEDVAEAVLADHPNRGLQDRFLGLGGLLQEQIVRLFEDDHVGQSLLRTLRQTVSVQVQSQGLGEHDFVRGARQTVHFQDDIMVQ